MGEHTRGPRPIFIGLVHFPVVNRGGEPVTSAITNLDIHDIARTSLTYDIRGFFVISPSKSQQGLLREIMGHWLHGPGLSANPHRAEAFRLIRVANTIEEACGMIEMETAEKVELWATSARDGPGRLHWDDAEERVFEASYHPIFILFGTASGLAMEVFENSDFILEPIKGKKAYNHLSVRSAVAITLDRLLARRS